MHFDCCDGCGSSSIVVDGRQIDLADVGSVWWRRPQYPAASEQMVRPSHRAFARNETYEALGGLWLRLDTRWINEPGADDRAHRKGYQLSVAQQIGLEIPRTLMTNDPDEALRFVDGRGYRNVIYKSFSSTESEWRETRVLRAEEIEMLHQVRHAPVIFQEYVPAMYDLRVTVVGTEVFAAAIHSQETEYPVDSRIDIINAEIEPVVLPDHLSDLLLQLTDALGLVYGAIDLRRTPDDRYVFLEINPSGQFRYIEVATGLPITAALAAVLMANERKLVESTTT
jgi:glutathione synthase/RimK-type ligase-like ATP-grasp enzyme